jgi:hypothetical protein
VTDVVFVAPYALDATTRFLSAVIDVPGARVGLVSSDPLERFPRPIGERVAGHWRLDDCLDPGQLTVAVTKLGHHLGSVDRLVAILENLQVPLGEVRDRLGLPGMGAAIAGNFRDKDQMKQVFELAGVPCARHLRAESSDDVRAFAATVGLPFVVKPLSGSGARNTFRVEDAGQLAAWIDATSFTPADPVLLEEFLVGEEHSFESVLVDGELIWHSIGRYLPTPLDVLENPWIQWCVLLPRHIDGGGYDEIRDVGTQAVTALGLRTGLSHMEWFRRADGSVAVSEVGARPPGAQFMTLMSWAHDADLYAAWAGLAVGDRFEPPPRRYAVGAAYLRAQGVGRSILAVHGVDRVSETTRSRVVAARLPEVGGSVGDTYEGDGFVIVRDPETSAVEQALAEIVTTIRVECG